MTEFRAKKKSCYLLERRQILETKKHPSVCALAIGDVPVCENEVRDANGDMGAQIIACPWSEGQMKTNLWSPN